MLIGVTVSAASAGYAATARKTSTTTSATTKVPPIPAPPKKLVKAAEAEGKLTLYISTSVTTTVAEVDAAFERKYPGITATPVSLGNASSAAKFLANAQAGAQAADIIFRPYDGFFAAAYHDGFLTPLDKIIPGFKSHFPAAYIFANGVTAATFIGPIGFTYNTNLVPAADVPKSFADFARPFWQGHLASIDPNTPTPETVIAFWIKKFGPTTAHEIWANVGQKLGSYATGPAEIASVAAGNAWVGLEISYPAVAALIAVGAPLKYVDLPTETGNYQSVGVAKQAPDPAAAQLFAYWAYSKAGQISIDNAWGGVGGPLNLKVLPKHFVRPDLTVTPAQTDSFLGISSSF